MSSKKQNIIGFTIIFFMAIVVFCWFKRRKNKEENPELIPQREIKMEMQNKNTYIVDDSLIPDHCKYNYALKAESTNFALNEFTSRDGGEVPLGLRGNIKELMQNLETLRDVLKKPILIHSGYRTPNHNASVGGADKSTHLCGLAVDFKVRGVSPEVVVETIEQLIKEGKMKQGGLKAYKTFTHYDIRGTKARW